MKLTLWAIDTVWFRDRKVKSWNSLSLYNSLDINCYYITKLPPVQCYFEVTSKRLTITKESLSESIYFLVGFLICKVFKINSVSENIYPLETYYVVKFN